MELPRLRLPTLFIMQAIAALFLFFYAHVGIGAIVLPGVLMLVRTRYGKFNARLCVFAGALSSITLFQIGCFQIAYYTLGEVRSGYYLLLLILNAIPLLLCLARRPRSAVVAAIVLLLVAAPVPLMLGYRLMRVEQEVRRLVRYVREVQVSTGEYPAELETYKWTDTTAAGYVRYSGSAESFIIYYHAGNPNAPHWYSSNAGWGYYPD